MTEKWTHAGAFAYFKAKGTNPRWSWSARSEDGKTVVLTLWQDEFGRGAGKQVSYHARVREDATEWIKRPGNRERLENLKWAKEHCDGLFRVVVGIAEDVNARPRAIKECFPHKNLVMCIVDLNEETGEFHAISVTS
jgi:hypothetical protein